MRRMAECAAEVTDGGFELDYSIQINATRQRVFDALTTDVHRWWPHTVSETPHQIVLEPQIGGRFMELFDDAGRGVLYGVVEIYDPPATLRIRGSVGMGRAVNLFWTITLEDTGGGCRVREQCRASGDTTERLMEGMRRGTEEEYEVLRRWVEEGVAVR